MPETSNGSANATPTVNYILLNEQAANPATAANQGVVFTKDDAGSTELFYRKDSSGAVVQLTGAGGGAQWIDTGVFLYPSGGSGRNVAIGAVTMSGAEKLRVVGDILIEGNANHITGAGGAPTANEYFSLTGLNQPFTNDFSATNYAAFELQSNNGGLVISGMTQSDKTGLIIQGFIGSTTPTSAAAKLVLGKKNGVGGFAVLSSSEVGFEITNAGISSILDLYGNGDLKIRGGLYAGSLADTTHANFLSNNQIGFQITAPLTAGDPYLQNISVITDVKLLANQAGFAISGFGSFTSTNSTNTHTFSQLLGGQYTVQHDGVGNIDDAWAGIYSAHNVGVANAATLRSGVFVYANTGAGTVTNAAAVFIEDPNNDASNNNITNAYGIFIQSQSKGTNKWAIKTNLGKIEFGDRYSGTSVAAVAANDLTLGAANQFIVSGNTQINAIIVINWVAGSKVTLIFSGTPIIKHNTAGGAGTAKIFLSGSVDLVAANNTVLGLEYDGTQWQEVFRKAP